MYKCNAATCVDVYQAALMRRGTPKHACLQIVLYIYIYIYIYTYIYIYIYIISTTKVRLDNQVRLQVYIINYCQICMLLLLIFVFFLYSKFRK